MFAGANAQDQAAMKNIPESGNLLSIAKNHLNPANLIKQLQIKNPI
jgi:hypothetical protein